MTTQAQITSYRELTEFLNTRLQALPTKTVRLKETLDIAGKFLKDKTTELEQLFDDFELTGNGNFITLTPEVKPYWSALQKIQRSLATDKFKDFLKKGIGFDAASADNFLEQLSEQDQFVDYVQQVYNNVKNAGFNSKSMRAHRESEKGYEAVFKKPKLLHVDCAFSTLLNGLRQYKTAENAEFFARLELYVESGWAAKDFEDVSGRKRRVNDTLQVLFDLTKLQEENPEQTSSRLDSIRQAFESRFGEIFESVKISGSNANRGAKIEGLLGDVQKSGNGTAQQRRVDAFIRDANNREIAYACVVTSNKNSFKAEGDQVITHYKAVSESIKKGIFGGVKEVKWSYMAPSLLSDLSNVEGNKEGRGRKFQTCFHSKGLSSGDVETINLLPLMAGLLTNADTSIYPNIDLRVIGGSLENWEHEKKLCNNQDEVERLIARQAAQALAILGSARREADITSVNIPGIIIESLGTILSVMPDHFKADSWTPFFDSSLCKNATEGLTKLGGSDKTYATTLKSHIRGLKSALADYLEDQMSPSV